MSEAKEKKKPKNTKKTAKKDEKVLKKKGIKPTYKKDLSSAEFLSVEEMCSKFNGKISN